MSPKQKRAIFGIAIVVIAGIAIFIHMLINSEPILIATYTYENEENITNETESVSTNDVVFEEVTDEIINENTSEEAISIEESSVEKQSEREVFV